ncbi:AMP-binding protein [Blattabacterium cuenoti]|uniref:AMP-binding protein n=1 Tax=Blattabacterium cuenoti TaxID=1653831 RepID=UPI001EEBC525|nr:AMP-binding protein [Blattabacterium cuenoti]
MKERFFWKNAIFQFLKDWYNDDPVLSVFTSGTTGIPKKILVKKKHFFERAKKTVEISKLKSPGIKGLLCLSPNFIAAKIFLVRAIIFKWKVYCVPPSSNPLRNIKEYFDIASMVPMQVFSSLEYLKYIKILLIGGCSIPNFLEEKLKNISSTICYATYGMTETLGHIAVRRINGSNRSIYYKSFGDIYLKKDKRNCLKIFSSCSMDSWIQTNDIVSIKSDNEFYWIGRYDNIINSGGIKIIPELIEKNISFFIPDRRYFISSISDKILGEKLILVIEGDPFKLKIPKNFFCGKNKFYKPKKIFFITHFTETLLGKINRNMIMKKLIQKI